MEVKLYIGEMQVDLNDNSLVLFNWQETDLSNPTLIKNGYSKTITLEGTDKNNEIFGHFWDLERHQMYGGNNRAEFNPSYRVPFILYYNGSVYERGYVKLQRVITKNGVHQYEIGLFGGLGGFFYNLDIDWNTGNKKTLADMDYMPDGYYDERPDRLEFTIDRYTVSDFWDNLKNSLDWPYNRFYHINFAPTYNGLPETNFDADKVLINFNGINLPQVSGNCTTYNGYALGKLPDKLTSEEVKDYRSYLQTPVVRVKSVIEAICKKANNRGKYDNGYDVVLDPDFFNNNNPYYHKSFMTLNRLTFKSKGEVSEEIELGDLTPVNEYIDDTGKNLVFAINNSGKTGTIKVSMNLRVSVPTATDLALYMCWSRSNFWGTKFPHYEIIPIQGFSSDSLTANEIKYTSSKLQWVSESILLNSGVNYYSYDNFKADGGNLNNFVNSEIVGVKNYDGWFKRISNGVYEFIQPIEFEVDYPSNAEYLKIRMGALYSSAAGAGVNKNVLSTSSDYDIATRYDYHTSRLSATNKSIEYNVFDDDGWNSGKRVTQEDLLSTSFSPAEFLINYCKQFGLYIYKDTIEDKIYISTRNNFFKKNEIKNLDEVIDTSKEIEINPLYVDTNYVSLTATGVEGENYKDYYDRYGKAYGQKVVDTGYEFNADTKELVSSPFKNAIQTRDRSLYYFKTLNGLNPYVYNGFSYNLYKNGDYDDETITIEIPKKEISTSFQPLYDEMYYDIISKPQFEDVSHKGISTEGVFLFFNGYQDVSDDDYYLTDDNSYMAFLNNNPCWLMSKSPADSLKIEQFPKFSRYYEGNKWMMYSWDYGSPRELYVPDMTNNDDVNIYSLYFKKYYSDLYDINTKVLTCYIKADDLTEDCLRNIYWFRNGLWRLNRVIDYNPESPNTTKCEFIKIQDLDNLTNEEATTKRKITITLDRYDIGQSGGTIIGTVRTSDNFGWDIEEITYDPTNPLPRGLVTVTPQSYGQSGNFTLTVPSNIRDDREVTIKVSSNYNDDNVSGSTSFTQPGVEYQFGFNPAEFSGGTLQNSKTLNIENPYYYDWNISNKPNWITITPSSVNNGQYGTIGNTACTLTMAKNTTEVERTGMVTISETTYGRNYTFPVKQAGYVFSISPNTLNYGKNGEAKTVTINNPYGYSWEVISKPDWITTGTSSGNLTLTAGKNIVFERSGSVVIRETDFNKEYTVTVNQESGYVFSISPSSFNFVEDGDSNTLTIENPNQMAWTITNYPSWVTINPSAGTGTSVSVGAVQNTGIERSATSICVTETLCNQKYYFDVTQDSGYMFSISPTALTFTSAQNNKSFNIYNDYGYNWEIVGLPTWLTTNIRTGNTTTQVTLRAEKNIGPERSVELTVRETTWGFDYTLSIVQESGYIFEVSPLSFSFIGDGESKNMTITNPNGLDWQIEELPYWITVNPVDGNDSKTVVVTARANGRGPRNGEFIVNESTFGNQTDIAVSQESGYTFTYSPNVLLYLVSGGSQTVQINDPDNYAWTITNIPNWLTFSQTAGTASATITITASENSGSSQTRRQSVKINENDYGNEYPIQIDQYGYRFEVSPYEFNVASGQATTQLGIYDPDNMGWEITNIPSWVSVATTAGTGTALIDVTHQSNGGNPARTGTFKVTELMYSQQYTITINQESGYVFSANPTTFNFDGTGGTATMTITNPYSYNWMFMSLPNWVTASETAGTSTAVTFTVGINGGARRTSQNVKLLETSIGAEIPISFTQEEGDSFTYSPSSFSFVVQGEGKTLTITNPDGYNWSITNLPSWISVNYSTGNTSKNVTVTATSNGDTDRSRSGSFTLNNITKNKSYTINVEQAGNTFYVSPPTLQWDYTGGTNYIHISNANGFTWVVENYPSWITPASTSGTDTYIDLVITASSNAGNPERISTLKVRETTLNTSFTIDIGQSGNYRFSVSPSTISYDATGGTQNITITNPDGHSWEFGAGPMWISAATQYSGTTTATVGITVLQNWNSSSRSATLVVRDTTSNINHSVEMSQAGETPLLTPSINSITATVQNNPAPTPPTGVTWYLKNNHQSLGLFGNWTASNGGYIAGDLGPGETEDQTTPVPFNLTAFTGAVQGTGAENITSVSFINKRSYQGGNMTYTGAINAWTWSGSVTVQQGDIIEVTMS